VFISGTYNILPNRLWAQSQTRREVLECQTDLGSVTINLPLISQLIPLNAQNVIFTINDFGNNANINNITINASGSDVIDIVGSSQLVITTSGIAVVLGVGSNGKWVAVESNEISNVPTTNSFGLYSQIADGPVVEDTDVATSVIGSGVGTLSVPANTFRVGDTFIARIGGKISVQNNNRLKVDICTNGNVLATSGFISLGGATDKDWFLETDFVIRSVGAATIASIHSNSLFRTQRNGGQQFEGFVFDTTNNTTFDTTIINTLDIQVTWETASVNNTLFSDFFVLTKIY
jgi:hypothetical protein